MNLFFKLLSLPVLALAALPLQAQECSCAEAFEQTVQVYEKDYSLFNHKVTDENRDLYAAYTQIFRTRANEITEIENCLPVLEQWLQFFRDGHNSIVFTGESGKENRRERMDMDRQAFMADYKKKGYEKNDLLSLWKYGPYEVAIVPNPESPSGESSFIGLIVSSTDERWQVGDVKFKLTPVYGNEYEAMVFMDDYSTKKVGAKLNSPHKLEFEKLNYWSKSWPDNAPVLAGADETKLYSKFHIRMIEGEIPYIRFPNFYERDAAFVDSLLKAHHEALLGADFIIVDVRDNAGGSDGVYKPVLPYVLSGPIRIPNSGIWVSEGNLELIFGGIKREDLQKEEDIAEYDFWVSKKNSIHWFDEENYARTDTPDTLYSPEKKVAVLINENTFSSGETFVYRVQQSDKVVLYGQNTGGVVDGFMVFTRSIGCFDLKYPSSFRAKDIAESPVDPYGFEPDVYLGSEEDALEFSLQHMRQLLKDQKKAN